MPSTHTESFDTALVEHNLIKNRRITSLDLFKVLAIFAVVTIHSQPFSPKSPYISDTRLGVVVDLCCRFAVPFFFMVSGYFFAEKVSKGSRPIVVFGTSAKRLISVYVVWCLFYFLVPLNYLASVPKNWFQAVLNNWQDYAPSGAHLLLNGTYDVLWFLPALIIALLVLTLSHRFGWKRYLAHLSIALYGVGLLWGSYSALWFPGGASELAINTRNGPFFGTPFVVLGWVIFQRQKEKGKVVRPLWAIAIALSGLLLQFIEASWLMHKDLPPNGEFDYLIGTVVFSTGIFLLALSKPYLADGWPVLNWSRYTLGVFLFHPIILNLVKFVLQDYSNLFVEVGEPVVIYFISLGIVVLAARYLPVKQWLT